MHIYHLWYVCLRNKQFNHYEFVHISDSNMNLCRSWQVLRMLLYQSEACMVIAGNVAMTFITQGTPESEVHAVRLLFTFAILPLYQTRIRIAHFNISLCEFSKWTLIYRNRHYSKPNAS
jgi:hypothetical protein